MFTSIIFIIIFLVATVVFYRKVRKISQSIKLGKDIEITDNKPLRWRRVLFIAIGQEKMLQRPVAALMHIFVYAGFIIVNIEMLEILIDGVAGTHRLFSFFGGFYSVMVSIFEFFAVTVMFGCAIFLIRRNILRIKRFWNKEMTLWPRSDANIILITELLLMSAILIMNATDGILQTRPDAHYTQVGSFIISGIIQPIFSGLPSSSLIIIERFCWWFHIVGVLVFLNYIPYSKHFHVFLSFPNVYYSKLRPAGEMANMPSITKEVKLMLEENYSDQDENSEVVTFGAKTVRDLTWKHLMDVYSCTECGRCTSSCPANITGKKLSPRKIVMDTRDNLEEVADKLFNKKSSGKDDEKNTRSLFDFISAEELWACTTCNACTYECPVNIDPLAIILEMRRYLVLEESAAPGPLNNTFSNIENNGAPWQFSQEDRMEWAKELMEKQKIDVPVMADLFAKNEKPEYLFWVGSAGAFDDRYKNVVKAFVKILAHLGVSYAVLGTEESSTGDVARRAGNEMLFQMQAMMNIELLNGYEVKKILTCDPHAFNTFKNEYPQYDGNYQVIHHTQFLKDQIEAGNLKVKSLIFNKKIITYHDPCYLGRINGEYAAPRKVLDFIPSEKKEMKRNKSKALCCGAGGGQMFKEAEKGDKEIFIERTEEALETGADIIVTACPYCMAMITDGIKYKDKVEEVKNYDIAEIVSLSLGI